MISDHADPLVEIGSKESGGQNIYVYYLSRFLAKKGVYVDVYTRWDRGNKKEIVKYNSHVRVIRVKAGPKNYIPRDEFLGVLDEFGDNILKRIKREKLKYDVIHSNYWYSGLAGLMISKIIKAPLIHVFHSIGKVRFNTLKHFKIQKSDYYFFQKRIAAEQRIASRSSSIIATSPVEKQIIKRLFNIDGKKIKFIPIGVDFRIFRSIGKRQARRKLGISARRKVILYVGRIEWRKGIGTLLYSLKKIAKKHPSTDLWIIGGGKTKTAKKLEQDERIRQENIIRELDLRKNVKFLGPKNQKDLFVYFSAADVCAVPSYYEPFGIVPLESMACGTPVVASKTGGLQYTVKDGITGYLAEPRNYHDLSRKINLVFEKNKDYFSENCIKRVNENFDWDKISQDYIDYFREIKKER